MNDQEKTNQQETATSIVAPDTTQIKPEISSTFAYEKYANQAVFLHYVVNTNIQETITALQKIDGTALEAVSEPVPERSTTESVDEFYILTYRVARLEGELKN